MTSQALLFRILSSMMKVNFSTVAGADYSASFLEVVISASTMNGGNMCVNISVMVIDDTNVELPENFTIEVTRSTPPVDIGVESSTTVIIIDDDSK